MALLKPLDVYGRGQGIADTYGYARLSQRRGGCRSCCRRCRDRANSSRVVKASWCSIMEHAADVCCCRRGGRAVAVAVVRAIEGLRKLRRSLSVAPPSVHRGTYSRQRPFCRRDLGSLGQEEEHYGCGRSQVSTHAASSRV